MADEKKLREAQAVYESICATYEAQGLKFDRHDEDFVITFSMRGEDIPMEFVMQVCVDAQIVRLYSRLPVSVGEDKTVEMALATVYANSKILNGAFDYDLQERTLSFNIFTAYHDSILGGEVFSYMLGVAAGTVDRVNDLFLMLGKGMITLEQFLERVNGLVE